MVSQKMPVVAVTSGVLHNLDGRVDCCLATAVDSVQASGKFQPFLKGSSSKYVIPGDGTPDCPIGHGNNLAGIASDLLSCFVGHALCSNAETEPGVLSLSQTPNIAMNPDQCLVW